MPNYSTLFKTVKTDRELSNTAVSEYILPRYELYGANILNFSALNTELIEDVLFFDERGYWLR